MKFLVRELRISGSLEQVADLDSTVLLGAPLASVKFEKPLHVQATAKIVNVDVLIDGVVSSQFGFECVRCLEKFNREIKSSFRQNYALGESDFDISEEVRESMLIEIPQNPVCDDDCEGLCSQCGANKNISKCQCTDMKSKTSKFADLRWQI